MKGSIQPDHIPKNKYVLSFMGLPPITFTKVSGLEEELDNVTLPDRTQASGGNTKAGEFTASMPTHHTPERNALENWNIQCRDPVSPAYKKTGTLTKQSLTGMNTVSYILQGCFISKRSTPDVEMSNEGELDEIEWTFKFDQIIAR